MKREAEEARMVLVEAKVRVEATYRMCSNPYLFPQNNSLPVRLWIVQQLHLIIGHREPY